MSEIDSHLRCEFVFSWFIWLVTPLPLPRVLRVRVDFRSCSFMDGDVSGTTFPVDAEEEDTEMHVSSQGSCKSFDARYGVPQDDFSPITFVVLFFL